MAVKKIVNTLISKLDIDVTRKFQGTFGGYSAYIDCQFDDLIAIAKIIHDNALLQQIKKAHHDFSCGKIKRTAWDLDSLANKNE